VDKKHFVEKLDTSNVKATELDESRLANEERAISLPWHVAAVIKDVIRTSRRLAQELGRDPTNEEIAKKIDIPVFDVGQMLTIAQEPISLEAVEDEEDFIQDEANPEIGDQEDVDLSDLIEDRSIINLEDQAVACALHDMTDEVLATLSPRQREVIRLRFGLGTAGSEHTLEEVGEQLGLTRERIRQIEAEALHKLRHPSRSRKLKAFLETVQHG